MLASVILWIPAQSHSFEAFDRRIQVHGFAEAQLRALAKGYSAADGWDLAQWYNVLNLELELDLVRDGWGPFEEISGFVRVDVRYDCVWSGGCGMFRSANTYGNQAKRLPKRFSDGRRIGYTGVIRHTAVETDDDPSTPPVDFTDRRPYTQVPLGQGGGRFGVDASPLSRSVPGQGQLARIWNAPIGLLFFAFPGHNPLGREPNGRPTTDLGRADDDLTRYPGSYIAQEFLDYRFGVKQVDGVNGGEGTATLGPWRPIDRIVAFGALADRPNPYAADRLDGNGILQSVVTTPLEYDPVTGVPAMVVGVPELTFRPATAKHFDAEFDIRESQGLYYPSAALISFLDEGAQVYDQNFSQTDLAWNHGASQSDERELREAYLDLDTLDGRLWARLGRQVIVWGKTELFRAVDQFNPQDFGLASLPSLEESRIPVWAARTIVTIGDIGPIQDLRIEGAMLLDQYEPADFGRCGEPYSPILICGLSVGLLSHALIGTGLAGEVRPPDPWDDVKGLEGGIRIEWRAGRFSFSLSDYYGYDDFPYIDQLNVWERNVDPVTGRPRRAGARGACTTGDEPACLGVRPYRIDVAVPGQNFPDRPLNPEHRKDLLLNSPANQQLFATVCASSVGIQELPSACALTIWNSPTSSAALAERPIAIGAPLLASAFGSLLTGGIAPSTLGDLLTGQFLFRVIAGIPGDVFPVPLVRLHRSRLEDYPGAPDDGPNNRGLEFRFVGLPFQGDSFNRAALAPYLTNEQEALLGCGFYWGNPCDITGFDLFNTEASAFFQSWPGIEGTGGTDWDTWVGVQPGTLDFVDRVDPRVCTRAELGASGRLEACRDILDVTGFDPRGLSESEVEAAQAVGLAFKHPFFGPDAVCIDFGCPSGEDQFFSSEIATLSFNALMTFVITSVGTGASGEVEFFQFDPDQPYRQDGCSLRKPLLCGTVQGLLGLTGVQRNTVRAGGNDRFGRRDFLWHSGAVVGLRRYKRNVLGFAFDFAEDITKTSWAIEVSWLNGVKMGDFDERDGLRTVDQVNLVMSVDRSTFINFLNANRTFFINSQLFLRYIPQHRESMPINGPVNALATLSILTGYWQDRLNPALTFVHDFQSESGAVLAGATYRYSERLSATVGLAWFYGTVEERPYPLTPAGVASAGAGKGSYKSYVQNGLSAVRDRDEVYLRLRYTF